MNLCVNHLSLNLRIGGMNLCATPMPPPSSTLLPKTSNFNPNSNQIFPTTKRLGPQLGRSSNKMMVIRMRDRSKNRKPLQRGRNLSIEAIQTVQSLKRAHSKKIMNEDDDDLLDQVFVSKVRRLLKFDMVAVLRELLRQNECLLALKVFEDIRKEHWYKPQVSLYTDMILVLESNGLFDKVELLFMQMRMESCLECSTVSFNALLACVINNFTDMAVECFHLMKSVGCEPDKSSFKILIVGLESKGETDLAAVIRQEAQKYYGESLEFLKNEEDVNELEIVSS